MVKTPPKAGYYTPSEVADLLKVCRTTIWRYIRSGKLKAIKLSIKNYRISEKDLKRFLNKKSK